MNDYKYVFESIINPWTKEKVIIGLKKVFDCGCVYESPEFDRFGENATEFYFDIRTNCCDRHWNELYKLAAGF